MYSHVGGCCDTDTDLIALDPKHGYSDVFADPDGFADASGKNEHLKHRLLNIQPNISRRSPANNCTSSCLLIGRIGPHSGEGGHPGENGSGGPCSALTTMLTPFYPLPDRFFSVYLTAVIVDVRILLSYVLEPSMCHWDNLCS